MLSRTSLGETGAVASGKLLHYTVDLLASGSLYLADEETKNLAYNVLDVVTKALFDVVLFLYYGKVLKF